MNIIFYFSSLHTDVEAPILKLKEQSKDFDIDRTVAIMIACVARGHHQYRKRNVESGIFRKHFPNTPIIGIFGNGEIGMNFPIAEADRLMPINLMHSFTTFITLICLPCR